LRLSPGDAQTRGFEALDLHILKTEAGGYA
jgi:hypothetical protein